MITTYPWLVALGKPIQVQHRRRELSRLRNRVQCAQLSVERWLRHHQLGCLHCRASESTVLESPRDVEWANPNDSLRGETQFCVLLVAVAQTNVPDGKDRLLGRLAGRTPKG